MTEGLTREQVAEIKATILARGITVEGVAQAANLTPEIVVMVMQGRLRPELHIRKRLAEALGIDPKHLQ